MKKPILLSILLFTASMMYAQWKTVNPYPTSADLHDICLFESGEGYAVGDYGTVLYTPDAGTTWFDRSPGDTAFHLYAVSFTDLMNGWVTGENGFVLSTSDGGLTWSLSQPMPGVDFLDICFTSLLHGCAVGRYGKIITTSDGGNTWTNVSLSNYSPQLNSLCFSDEQNGWAVGNPGNMIIHTNDGGYTWVVQESFQYLLYCVDFSDSLHGCAIGQQGRAYYTCDGGETWELRYAGASVPFMDIQFVDDLRAFALGRKTNTHTNVIVGTLDGGLNWTVLNTLSGPALHRLAFHDSFSGLVV
ncbi:MAG: hypothetical protein HQ542_01315 [Bacteroidia bacterium]|nr:hypothetical protein [Bacteroidia bacterium]